MNEEMSLNNNNKTPILMKNKSEIPLEHFQEEILLFTKRSE